MRPPDDLESIPPTPRSVRWRRGYYLIVMKYVMLFFIVIFAAIFWQVAIGQVRIQYFSTIVPARVTEVRTIPGDRGPSYEISIAYRYNDTDYAIDERIGLQEAESLKVGDAIQVWVLPERPGQGHRYYPHYPGTFVMMISLSMALMPTVGFLKVLWDLFIVPWKLRALLRNGEATNGTIVDRKMIAGRSATYTLTYEYRAPPDHAAGREGTVLITRQDTMKVHEDDFQEAQVGDTVVVIYRADWPSTGTIARYTDYEIVAA